MQPDNSPLSVEDPFAALLDSLSHSAAGCCWGAGASAPAVAPEAGPMLSPGALPANGDRVAIIGVIDHAIPFAHRNLTTDTACSRVAAIWLQGAPADGLHPAPADIGFGQEWLGSQIDRLRLTGGTAMPEETLYRLTGALSFRRAADATGAEGQDGGRLGAGRLGAGRLGAGLAAQVSHGAAVTGLAVGMAPDHPDCRNLPVIAVSLPDHLVADTSGAFSPYFVQAAVVYIVSRARRLARELRLGQDKRKVPLIVNLSFGVTAGPRDGSLGLEQLQDLIARDACDDLHPVHFVLPSGNHRLQRLHGQIGKGKAVLWQLPPDDPTPNVVEIWGGKQSRPDQRPGIELFLTLPGGQQVATDFGDARDGISILRAGGAEIARAYRQFRRVTRQQSGEAYWRQCLTLIAGPTVPGLGQCQRGAPSGLWRIAITDGPPGAMDIDVQRDDRLGAFPGTRRQSRLYAEDYQPLGPTGRVVADDPAGAHSVLRRRGSANAYGSGDSSLRVGGRIGGPGGVTASRPLSDQPASQGIAPYTGLLADGQPGDLLAKSDGSDCLSGVRVPGCLSGSSGAMSGTSVAAPQVTRWLADEILKGVDLPDRAAVIAHARAHGGPKPGRGNPRSPRDLS